MTVGRAQSTPDVLVLGGGPAGCAAARLLALWGHDVRLWSPPTSGGGCLAESIPPSCGKLFDVLGVSDAVDAAGFIRSAGNTVWWGDGQRRVEPFVDGGRGWQVTAGALSAVLRGACQTAGVRIEDTRASAQDLDASAASFTLDCTGRSGVIARGRGWRVYEAAHRTVALVGAWRAASWSVPDPTHTLVESYGDGWAWSVPFPNGLRSVAVMVDPRTSNLSKGDGARATYRAEIHKTRQFAALLADATLEDGPSGWDASMYASSRYTDDNVLLVGDAASFIDPLSSAGIKKALASAWLAAVVVHTALVNPSMRTTALEFFSMREAEIYASFHDMTERYFAHGAAGHDQPFWNDRQAASADDGADDERELRAAFERLRDAPALALRQGTGVRIEPRAAVSGSEIILEARITTASLPQGVRFVHDVDLVTLLDLAPTLDQVPDLFDAYRRRSGPVALPDFLAALSTAVARGWLSWS